MGLLTKSNATKQKTAGTMVKAHVERTIDVPIDRAWEIISDFSNVHKIHPLVKTVNQHTRNDRGLGATRTCNLYDGNKAVERIEEWNEANHSYVVTVLDSTLPMKSIDIKLKALKVSKSKSKLVAEMKMHAKYGLLGKIMEHLVIKKQLGGAVGNLFAGVEEYNKTGKEIQKGYKAKTPAVVV